MADKESTPRGGAEFDPGVYPADTCFHERRLLPPDARPARKDRRRRIDPTTFEKQYSSEEMEFMNAMQQFKIRSGKAFPTYGEVLGVARKLGYEKTGEASDIPGMK